MIDEAVGLRHRRKEYLGYASRHSLDQLIGGGTLFEGTHGTCDIAKILKRMEANCPRPSSTSRSLWHLRRATNVSGHQEAKETLLEKAVAMLAGKGHMPGWYNQCPTASGIGGSSNTRRSNVDLVHWSGNDGQAAFFELKWDSNSPTEAVEQILRYGAAYLFCRRHRNKLPVGNRELMVARDVALRVVAPSHYYDADATFPGCLTRARASLEPLDAGFSLSLDALAFPNGFRLPFTNGAEVQRSCSTRELTDAGRKIVAAFDGLTSVDPEGGRM